PCHGIIRSVLYGKLGVDYGDVILTDGAPITHHTYGEQQIRSSRISRRCCVETTGSSISPARRRPHGNWPTSPTSWTGTP
ncbi:hypothetical protein, partial [Escherichia coli]|uniref:hypothetical protein n=1 Tax=Escherichia coli TaxID=562 RepID=UPI003D76FD89